ncbi:hypothetical protein I3760_03G135700 [Carya illinoinensis]|uniref:C2 domain-containing protein n=1 Tax=Carya illinoinensis TaxID=32201 RepID=A0A8T1R487_CARIL|nr:uncharacterized protein LOC122304579 [Carya illinoinensis]KAG2716626.1 hypothetical protein I3760_03G135700 [Carya illinoinensis]KAG6660962.1 hypothetical protein CIPAW_03G141500 [Carya illinoinensis]KAG6721965.1 hypothetical protein I3842_03G138200 [Carya illinoinensis]
MGAPDLQFSSLSCKLSIIQAKHVEFKSTGTLFVRCYLSAGNNKRIRLNSREISCRSFLSWNESLLLDCVGSQDSIGDLMQENLVFELRWRNKVPVIGRIVRSKLLGRGEIPWKEVFESPKMEMEKYYWVTMIPTSGEVLVEDVELPKLQVGMKVQVPAMAEKDRRRNINGKAKKWDDCGCGCKDGRGCSYRDYDVFALAAALEAF